ncbi:MAG: hypothetical protein FWE20_05545 [Defluviitaleaceae bacterium]|nr:hypothetical protein [Defluviitaleaceae bacterium]
MAALRYKIIPKGVIDGKVIPLNVVFVLKKDVDAAGITDDRAIHEIAKNTQGASGISIFDMDAVTTTSDGIMIDGAIIKMGAADNGLVNPDFGILAMAEIPYSDQIVEEEPHLIQWKKSYSGRKLFRGPDPSEKIIPVHNVVISGRAANNNSATEMMDIVTMEEILLPILGQMQCITGGDVLVGMTGEMISVGIGMTIAEKFGRVFPTRQFKAGESAHDCGIYAKTLKKDIPCIVAEKRVLADYTMKAIENGCVPARELGCSPVVLCVAKHMGAEIDVGRITAGAQAELDAVGITREFLAEKIPALSREEILRRADELLPGVENAKKINAKEIVLEKEISVG